MKYNLVIFSFFVVDIRSCWQRNGSSLDGDRLNTGKLPLVCCQLFLPLFLPAKLLKPAAHPPYMLVQKDKVLDLRLSGSNHCHLLSHGLPWLIGFFLVVEKRSISCHALCVISVTSGLERTEVPVVLTITKILRFYSYMKMPVTTWSHETRLRI